MVFELLNITRDSILAPLGLLSYSGLFIFELIDMIIMSFAIGYIFSGYIGRQTSSDYDPLKYYSKRFLSWENIKFAAIVAGLGVVFHELAHKFTAMAFGANAVLYAPYGFYLLAIFLKAVGFPFLFFVGGFVAHSPLPPLQSSLVSLAGPLTNFILWGAIYFSLKYGKINNKYHPFVVPFAKINLFLGIFNMIPLPGFDGFGVVSGLIRALF